jgi:dCMP deaminase
MKIFDTFEAVEGMKPEYISLYMDIAERISQMSHAKRLQVGSVIVKENTILSYGWNGMPTDWENTCEIEQEDGSLKTKQEVLHAETNAIAKVAQSTESSQGATLFCTHAPCIDCAKLIYQAGLTTVYYKETYRDDSGLRFLSQGGINVIQHSDRT